MHSLMVRGIVAGTAFLSLGMAACADLPTGTDTQVATVIEPSGWSDQTAAPGQAVAIAPRVLVRDINGRGVAGVTVQFAVTRGGGTLEQATVKTDATGKASAGRWTLGAAGDNEVEARTGEMVPVIFTAMAIPLAGPVNPPATPPVTGAFGIVTRYVGTASARQQAAVVAAVKRWSSVITADLRDARMNIEAGSCFTGQPAVNETVDDVLLFVEFVEIDGPGKVLGAAGPCYVRSENHLPIIGHLKLDAADLGLMEKAGTLDDVVLHEIGHVLGIGTLWEYKTLVTAGGTDDSHFSGAHATAAYRALGGTAAGVPLENTGEQGTRDSHWRETVFGNELMTGFIGGTPNPLSALTIASLQDLGYGATAAAAGSYSLGAVSNRLTTPIDMSGREHVVKPKYKIDRAGRKEKLRD